MEKRPDMPVQYLKGVGERRAQLFARLGIQDVGDLLHHYPRQYEDWSAVVPIAQAPVGEPCCIRAAALHAPTEHRIRKNMVLYKFPVSDGSAEMGVTLFNNRFAAAKIRAGETYLFYGTVSANFLKREMASPQIEDAAGGARIRPVYPQTDGLSSRVIETAVARALELLDETLDQDPLPAPLREAHTLCTRRYALDNIHFPADHVALSVARKRLVFEELLILQLGLLRLKGRSRGETGAVIPQDYTAAYAQLLPSA